MNVTGFTGTWTSDREIDEETARGLIEQIRDIEAALVYAGKTPEAISVGGVIWTWHPIEKTFHDFVVKNAKPEGRSAEVWMDGQKLKGVSRVELSTDAKDVNHITISFLAGSINKDDR